MTSLSEFLGWQLDDLESVKNYLARARDKSSGKLRECIAGAIAEVQLAMREVEEAQDIARRVEEKGGKAND